MASKSPEHSGSEEEAETSAWTEPPWSGWIETTGDALLILEAARRGLIPRVTRRLVDSERKMITSGSVFVFDEDESGIKRWTDGFVWSPSRILGNFLIYRETNKRPTPRGKQQRAPSPPTQEEMPEQSSEDSEELKGKFNPSQALSQGIDKTRERLLLGSLTNSHKYKVDGMVKKTFSITIGGVSQHLISYYKVADVENGRLRAPSTLPELATLEISPEYLDKTHFRQVPKIEVGPDGIPRYRGEAEELGPVSQSRAASSSSKGTHRYGPYVGAQSSAKKPANNGRKPRPSARQSSTGVNPTPPVSYDPYTAYYGMSYGYYGEGAYPNYNPYMSYYYGAYGGPGISQPNVQNVQEASASTEEGTATTAEPTPVGEAEKRDEKN